MSFSIKLQETFRAIMDCQLIRTRTASETNMGEFERLLNGCQPDSKDPVETGQYETVQLIYGLNRAGWSRATGGAPHLVLWTDARSIVRELELSGVIYLSYDGTQYRVSKHEKHAEGRPLVDRPPVSRYVRRGAPPPLLMTQQVRTVRTKTDSDSFV